MIPNSCTINSFEIVKLLTKVGIKTYNFCQFSKICCWRGGGSWPQELNGPCIFLLCSGCQHSKCFKSKWTLQQPLGGNAPQDRHCRPRNHIKLYHNIPYKNIIYNTIPCYTTLQYYTIIYYNIQNHKNSTKLYHTKLYHTILYHIITYHTILWNSILFLYTSSLSGKWHLSQHTQNEQQLQPVKKPEKFQILGQKNVKTCCFNLTANAWAHDTSIAECRQIQNVWRWKRSFILFIIIKHTL